MNDNLTLKQKIVLSLLGIFFNGTVFIIGILLNAIIYTLILFGVFALINAILEIKNLKNHAPAFKKLPDLFCCWFTSNFLLLICVLTMKLSDNILPTYQIIILGIVIMAVSTISISKIFYINLNIEKFNISEKRKLRDLLSKMSKQQAKTYLDERLPENESLCLYWLDFENKDIEYVAFYKMDCSSTTVKNIRHNAYERLININKSIDI
ncbi:MAG: hypothetical protein FWF92_07665 [Oscillospiraceae bacterium]|nr:hypothetical protein [Oscillospiraceae bacterium]